MALINRFNAPTLLPSIKDLRGCWVNGVFDTKMAGGCNIFGYDTTVWDKVKKEEKFMFSTALFSDPVFQTLAKKLYFRDLEDVYFSGTSGSDAVEVSIRAAYNINKNSKIACRQSAWHGGTLFASNLGSHPYFDVYKDMFNFGIVRKPEKIFRGYKTISELVNSDVEFLKQNKDVGVFIVEPIPSINYGLSYKFDRPDAYNNLREYCTENNIILIFDEVMSGFKTGKKYFTEHLEIDPDFLCLAKGLTAGVIPFSAVLARKGYLNDLAHGHTWSGNFIGAVAASHTIDYFYENLPNLHELIQEFNKYFDYVLGSYFSINKDKIKNSPRVIMPSVSEYDNVVLQIPSNTPKKHFQMLLKQIMP